ncbi:MAG: glycosyltransferase family protein [bacterium]
MVNPKYVIYHSCDSFDEWKPYEQKMINKSDVVFCTSEFIYNLRKKQHDNVHILRNACDKNMINSKWKVPKDLFKVILDDIFKYYKNKNELIEVLLAKVIEEDYSLKKILELDGIKKPDIFCMVGALGKWVDTTLIRAISEKYTTVFIGSEFGKRCPEDTLDLGVKKYSDLINYCNSCNVGLLPFRTSGLSKEITAAANPIKMWEYLACGLPVLATSWKETELPELKDVVFTAKTKEEYLKKADYLVNLPQEKYNEISKTAKKVASENTWEKRWNYMENIIGGMIN